MNDLFEKDLETFRLIERTMEETGRIFGYQEIRTPILEELALFKRGIGETTDIVEKEMFLVEDGEHTYCLRPENTAPVVRALIERGGISEDMQEKLYYLGPMFRKERPQKGRLRQFHQFGIELFGIREPSADIEVIVMVDYLFKSLGISNLTLALNTLGSNEERAQYKTLLLKFLSNHVAQFCEDCKRRMATNPLRVLDCKNETCRAITETAPKIIDSVGEESRMHFEQVQKGLTDQSVAFELRYGLVRGLDYYNRTVFEFLADDGLGSQNAVAAGGRYDGLFLTLGNKIDLPAIGCAGGLERMALLLDRKREQTSHVQLALVGADDAGKQRAQDIAFKLRKQKIAADFSLANKSIKAQMRRADRIGAKYTIVLGEQEIKTERVTIKNLATGQEIELPLDVMAIVKFINAPMQ
jgi:histidyl-tRNA synthetase